MLRSASIYGTLMCAASTRVCGGFGSKEVIFLLLAPPRHRTPNINLRALNQSICRRVQHRKHDKNTNAL